MAPGLTRGSRRSMTTWGHPNRNMVVLPWRLESALLSQLGASLLGAASASAARAATTVAEKSMASECNVVQVVSAERDREQNGKTGLFPPL